MEIVGYPMCYICLREMPSVTNLPSLSLCTLTFPPCPLSPSASSSSSAGMREDQTVGLSMLDIGQAPPMSPSSHTTSVITGLCPQR